MEKTLTLFGSNHCVQCATALEYLRSNHINFEYVDITGSGKNLKRFLKMRDSMPLFDDVKKEGRIGIPCLSVNDGEQVFLGVEGLDLSAFR